MTNRRGFLGLLAHLPLVGAWLARPKEWAPTHSGEIPIPVPPKDGLWLAECNSDGPVGGIVLKAHLEANGISLIRWIPVTERLPQIRPWDTNIFGIVGQSKPVLVSGSLGVMSATRFQYDSGNFDWGSASLDDVTHWAELPAPPAVS